MMNETIKNILAKRSIRSYDDRQVEPDKIDAIMECAQNAPSAMESQPWHFTVITNKELLRRISLENQKILRDSSIKIVRKLAESPRYDCFHGAPMAVIVSGSEDSEFSLGDCANAVENMAQAAWSMGLGTCHLGSFNSAMKAPAGQALLKDLQIPTGYFPLFALAVGYSSEVTGKRASKKKNTLTYLK